VRRWTNRITSAAKRQWSDPLSRGGLALLANTGLTGILGFGYWIVAARLFSTFAVGVAGALVAATTLFSGVGQLNLSGMLMRFLPSAAGKSRRLVLGTYACAAGAAAFLALAAMAGIRLCASPASPLRLGGLQSAALVLAAAAMAIFTIEDNVLVGLRRAVWVPVENGSENRRHPRSRASRNGICAFRRLDDSSGPDHSGHFRDPLPKVPSGRP
jgi:hypothetical protein